MFSSVHSAVTISVSVPLSSCGTVTGSCPLRAPAANRRLRELVKENVVNFPRGAHVHEAAGAAAEGLPEDVPAAGQVNVCSNFAGGEPRVKVCQVNDGPNLADARQRDWHQRADGDAWTSKTD